MADPGDPASDARSEVREVLTQAVAEFGSNVLSSATLLEGICEDRLPDHPREANLVIAAARADVRSMLDQQISSVGTDNAVRLSARTLADSLSITPEAAVWVVSEFARALGHPVGEDLSPRDTAAVANVPTSASNPETVLPEGYGLPPVGSPPPAVAGAPASPPPGGVPGGAMPDHPARRRRRTPVIVIALVIAAVGAFFGIAAAVKIPPFANSSSSANARVMSLIPTQIKNAYQCVAKATPPFGALAEVECKTTNATPASIPPDGIDYYLFNTSATTMNVYGGFLSQFAKVTPGAGNCENFKAWAPGCETSYRPGVNAPVGGHVVEYLYKGATDITSTVDKANLLVDMFAGGNAGNSLVSWWAQVPAPWLNGVLDTTPSTSSTTVPPSTAPTSTTTLPLTTTTVAPGTAPMSGNYVDGPDGTAHYFVTVTSQANGSLSGSVQFLAQDGNTSVAFTFTGTWQSGVATLNPAGGSAQNLPSSISMPYSPTGLSLGGCTGYLQFATSQASCQFSFNGSQI